MKLSTFIQKYKESDVIYRASIWFILVTITDKAISVLTQPFVNRIMTEDEVGIYNIYNTWHSVFAILATFYLYCGVLEVHITKNKEDTKQVVGSLMSLSMMLSIAFFGVCFVFIKPVSEILSLKPTYILLMGLSIISDAIIQFWCVPKRFSYSYKEYSLLVVSVFFIKSVLSVFLTALIYGDRVLGRIIGLTIPTVIVAIVLFFCIMRDVNYKEINKYWKAALVFNLPLIPHYLSTILLSSSDRVMIHKLSTDANTGLYSVAYSFSGLALIVFTALNNAYTPYAYKAINEKNYKGLRDKTNSVILVSVLFSMLLMLLAPEGLYILGGNKYLDTLPIIPVLVLGIFFSSFYFIFSNIEFVYEKTKYIFPVTVLGAGINIILNYILIPKIGYEVAAYTTLAGYLVIALCHYILSVRITGHGVYDFLTLGLYIGLLIATTVGSAFLYRVNSFIRYAAIALIGGLTVITLFKRKDLFKKN